MRQLADAPDDLLIEAAFPNARATTAAALGRVRENPSLLYYPPEPKREPRAFVLKRSRAMGHKRGRAEGSFVRETSAQAVEFYRDLVQNLKAWQAPAPKLHTEAEQQQANGAELAVVPAWCGTEPSQSNGGERQQGFTPVESPERASLERRPWDQSGQRR